MVIETGTAGPIRSWEVRTPVSTYNGTTYGQVIRDGRCVVEDEEVARVLQEDFHYQVIPPVARPAPDTTYPFDGHTGEFRAPRPQHPSEDARVAPFYPRDTTLPPGADPLLTAPAHSRLVRVTEDEVVVETRDEGTEDGESQER